MSASSRHQATALLDRLRTPVPLVGVELRPPRADLSASDSMDRWIDMQLEVRRLAARDAIMWLTDNAVGQAEEENLNHLATNLATEISPAQVVPFLTCKHSLEYCLLFAARAAAQGYQALTVLGGDRSVGPPRCVPHAFELRRRIRKRMPSLVFGGWANPHREAASQVEYLLAEDFTAEFYLTQVVSHHQIAGVEAFVNQAARRGLAIPGVFGVFYYRSAKPETLARLAEFLPVPQSEVSAEFAAGATPDEICARTIRALREIGVDRVYVANLGVRRAAERYGRVVELLD
jgi:hypothetical protein